MLSCERAYVFYLKLSREELKGKAGQVRTDATLPNSWHSHRFPLVGVIMGSDPDLPVMLPAAHILDFFRIPYELTIVSAHRTPDRLVEWMEKLLAVG